MCAFDSAVNFDEIGSKKAPEVTFGLRPNVTQKLANLLFFLKSLLADFQNVLRTARVKKDIKS